MLIIVDLFEEASNLKINRQKSAFLGINCLWSWLGWVPLANKFGCKVTRDHQLIWAFISSVNRLRSLYGQPIIVQIDKRLHSWHNNLLSKGGRLTLTSATLTNLPIFYLSLYPLLKWLPSFGLVIDKKSFLTYLNGKKWKVPLKEGCHCWHKTTH